ncbi:MAG: response regulator [Anaerolineae bacterium]
MVESVTEEPTDATGERHDEFASLVRDALAHLYDYAHLQRHPLLRLLAVPADRSGDGAKALRNLLLDTLEQLNPGDSVSPNDKEWRPYGILVRRYVDGFGIEDIVEELHISVRQFQREHRKGLLAAASVLRRHLRQEQTGAPPAAIEQPDELQQEMEQLGVIPERLDLGALLAEVLDPARALARGRGVLLEAGSAPADAWAWADRTLARQALLGALSTIIAGQPESVSVACYADSDAARLCIEVRPAIGQAEGASRGGRFGAVAEMMLAQGGALEPLAAGGVLIGLALRFRRAQGARVLVIDDNERVQQLFERYLAAEGYAVCCAGEAEEALAFVHRDRPDAIVLDVMMRNTDGWQLLQRFRADPDVQDVPVVVCSVLNEPELALALGARGYIKKPVSQQQMLTAIRDALAQRG